MTQMNSHIGRIARSQSKLGGFVPSSEHESRVASSNRGDDGDASSSDDEMTTSQ